MLKYKVSLSFFILFISFSSSASDNYKLDICNKVLADLCDVWGIHSPKDKPTLVWKETMSSLPLWSNAHEIKIHEPFYDICTSLGQDSLAALAVMLGHELHHIISKDDTRFKHNLENLLDESITLENDADIAGAFTAYLAGYKTKEIMPRIFEKIYKAYELKDEDMDKYPSLKQRKSVAKKVDKKVDEMILCFESATYLTTIGEYAMAVELLECLVMHYPNAEIYNNLGIAQLLLALRLKPELIAYAMPFELETDSELFRKGTKVFGFTPNDATDFIKSAIFNLKTAEKITITRDSKELTYINLAAAYIIDNNNNNNKEITKIIKKKRHFSNKGKSTINVLQGIIYALNNKNSLAKQKWDEAAKDPRLKKIAKYNQQVLKTGIPYNYGVYPEKRNHFMHGLLDDAKKDIFSGLCPEKKITITREISGTKKSLEVAWSNSNAIDFFLYRQKIKNTSVTTLQEIEQKYPNYFSIPTRKGQIIRIEEKNIFFILKKDIIVIWCEYNR
jgi:hypothetical protein